jgi:hypothetical protein
MDIAELTAALKSAMRLFKASGAKPQTKAIEAVEGLIEASGDRTVEEFVERTRAALDEPLLAGLSAEAIVERIAAAGTDQRKFTTIFKQLQAKDCQNEKVFDVAARVTGARSTTWRSKPKALQAIKSKFDERVFMASKDPANSRVTPW